MGVNAHSQSAAVAHRYGGHSMTAPLQSVMVRRQDMGPNGKRLGTFIRSIRRRRNESAAFCETGSQWH